jgi:opacity protein-like surface antigen
MRMKLTPRLILTALIAVIAIPRMYSQVRPAATQATFPISVGAGFSDFAHSYGSGTLLGGSLWIDYTPSQVPQILRGIGVEIEARDLSISGTYPQRNLREDTAEGGVIYFWRHFEKFHPYGKFLVGYGNVDTEPIPPTRRHDSRTITVMGGGVEYQVQKNIWVRGDYEFQNWPDFWKKPSAPGSLNPYGFTAGASYHF